LAPAVPTATAMAAQPTNKDDASIVSTKIIRPRACRAKTPPQPACASGPPSLPHLNPIS
jgi:hypothetical protein